MWSRAAWAYRTSFVLLTVATAVVTGLDIVAILLIFAHTPRLADFTLPEVMFLYGTSSTAFYLADSILGTVDRLGGHVKAGTFDVMLLRPARALVQVAADQFTPRRLGKVAQAVTVLVVSLSLLDVPWTPSRALLVPLMVAAGAVIYGAIWVSGAAFQFVATDASEALNAFTFGGNFLTQYPLVIYGREWLWALTWIVPLAFVNWQPALYVLGRPDPLGLPLAFRFVSPAVALALAVVAALAWRAGVRHYRSTGS
ncbi:MAG: transporter [Streptosporangiales bacterium]|nr:transporter [Streptosporangiales bacterium]